MTTTASSGPAAHWVPIADLKPWPGNPRRNDGEPVDRVAASIRRFGWGAPIVARNNGEIIAGHTRWKAAQKLGLERVPVRYVDLDAAEAHLLALADNKLNEAADWDVHALPELLSQYSLPDAELAGWTSKDLDKLADGLLRDDEVAGDETDRLATGFSVVVECADEQEQLHVIGECEARGWAVRALV